MSKDKYPSIFSPQMEAIVLIIVFIIIKLGNILGNIPNVSQLKLGNIRSRDVFRPIARERKYLMDYKRK